MRNLATTGRVLHIGAHPDDENTQLIAYFARGRGYDTAYLSITRGDGGQNILGPQFGEQLGVARTEELLDARRIDGGRQFFTRAIDFGFSKNPDETLAIWGHQAVLGDVVRVIRRFQPDVIVTRFPVPPGSGGHGHHTASAILAVEAFKLAADPAAYPEQLQQGLRVWQAKRIVWDYSGFSRGGGVENNPGVTVDIGGNDPVTGEPFASIAARSRAMHKTQAFGEFGARFSAGPKPEKFILLAGEPMTADPMDGVDPTWQRVPGGAPIGAAVADVLASFTPQDARASVPALLKLHHALAALPESTLIQDKREELRRVLVACLGLEVNAEVDNALLTLGTRVPVTVTVRANTDVPITWTALDCRGPTPPSTAASPPLGIRLPSGEVVHRTVELDIPRLAPVHQPYWLRETASTGMYTVDDPALIGLPTAGPDVPVTCTLSASGETLAIVAPLTQRASPDRAGANARSAAQGRADFRPPQTASAASATPLGRAEARPTTDPAGRLLPAVVVPPVSIHFEPGAAVVHPGAHAVLRVTLKRANGHARSGTLELLAPRGWTVSGPQSFTIAADAGQSAALSFEVTAPAEQGAAWFGARAVVDGIVCQTTDLEFSYPHIGPQLLQPPARKRVTSVAVATRGHAVGYVSGAGDDVSDALRQLGYEVTAIDPSATTETHLSRFDAIVLGVRALNTRGDLEAFMPALFTYAANGGTVILQYAWPRSLKVKTIAPYSLTLSDLRVTDETAAVTFLAPDHPALTTPNRITAADFEGWVQERGVNFASAWDSRFVPLLAMHDPGEPPLPGSLVVAPTGRGWFVYTGLDFFRELPAGVPGAYRLFANLVSLRAMPPPSPTSAVRWGRDRPVAWFGSGAP